MTLKINRASLLNNTKHCASCHHRMWNQAGIMIRKQLSCVLTSVTLTFDFWPWPFIKTSLLSLVITPENFIMILWWDHREKGLTDRHTDGRAGGRTKGRRTGRQTHSQSCLVGKKVRQTDRQTERTIHRAACEILIKTFFKGKSIWKCYAKCWPFFQA